MKEDKINNFLIKHMFKFSTLYIWSFSIWLYLNRYSYIEKLILGELGVFLIIISVISLLGVNLNMSSKLEIEGDRLDEDISTKEKLILLLTLVVYLATIVITIVDFYLLYLILS